MPAAICAPLRDDDGDELVVDDLEVDDLSFSFQYRNVIAWSLADPDISDSSRYSVCNVWRVGWVSFVPCALC